MRTKLEIEITRRKPGQYDRVETWVGYVPIEKTYESRQGVIIGSLDDGIVVYTDELVAALIELGVVNEQ